jgi:hypothetical protein
MLSCMASAMIWDVNIDVGVDVDSIDTLAFNSMQVSNFSRMGVS